MNNPTHLKMAMLAETCTETVKTNTIKLHADGNITSKLIEQYSAAGC
jgi:hypothetical protein